MTSRRRARYLEMNPEILAIRQDLLTILERLVEVAPQSWPEEITQIVGIACKQQVEEIDWFVDVAVQMSVAAHQSISRNPRYDF